MSAGQLLDFGFNPQGSPLGSMGSPSMPEDDSLGLGDPMAEAEAMLGSFVKQTQRRYGEGSDVQGGVWDPRGVDALSAKPSDYKTTDMMRPDEVAVQLGQSADQLGGGDPILRPFLPDNSGFAQALYDQNMGLSAQGAATLADTLAVYDPKILEGIRLPRQVEPRVTNALGLSTSDGGLPQEFFDPKDGGLKQGVPEAIDRVISQKSAYQRVDEHGLSNNYAPGTGPYDAIAKGIIKPPKSGASKPTPAQIRAYPRKFLDHGKGPGSAPPKPHQFTKEQLQAYAEAARRKLAAGSGKGPGSKPMRPGQFTKEQLQAYAEAAESKLASIDGSSGAYGSGSLGGGTSSFGSSNASRSSGVPVPEDSAGNEDAFNKSAGPEQSAAVSGDTTYGTDSMITSGTPEEIVEGTSSKPWWLLLVAAGAAIGGGILLMKKNKKGKRR